MTPFDNQLLRKVEYKIDTTPSGTWKRFLHPSGQLFEEYTSHRRLFGLPFVHYTRGRSPETGKRVVARGFFAVGRLAVGVVAVGHASAGVVAIGQAAGGLLLGLGQGATGLVALGQVAIGGFAAGQIAVAAIAIGQVAVGGYALGLVAAGVHAWSPNVNDPAAVDFFAALYDRVLAPLFGPLDLPPPPAERPLP